MSRRSARVLVAGFISGGTDDVDANMETVRLLRSQLRTKTNLRVIEAEVLPLVELAGEQAARGDGADGIARCRQSAEMPAHATRRRLPVARDARSPKTRKPDAPSAPARISRSTSASSPTRRSGRSSAKNTRSPLIITGTIMFTPQQTAGFVNVRIARSTTSSAAVVVPSAPIRSARASSSNRSSSSSMAGPARRCTRRAAPRESSTHPHRARPRWRPISS